MKKSNAGITKMWERIKGLQKRWPSVPIYNVLRVHPDSRKEYVRYITSGYLTISKAASVVGMSSKHFRKILDHATLKRLFPRTQKFEATGTRPMEMLLHPEEVRTFAKVRRTLKDRYGERVAGKAMQRAEVPQLAKLFPNAASAYRAATEKYGPGGEFVIAHVAPEQPQSPQETDSREASEAADSDRQRGTGAQESAGSTNVASAEARKIIIEHDRLVYVNAFGKTEPVQLVVRFKKNVGILIAADAKNCEVDQSVISILQGAADHKACCILDSDGGLIPWISE